MTKAFLVYFKEKNIVMTFGGLTSNSNPFNIHNTTSSTSCYGYPTDSRPILVIANNISDVGKRFALASEIKEIDVKDIIIEKNIDIIL